jgi:hypothetical protein
VRVHDAVDDVEPDARALAQALGGEERREDVGSDGGWDPWPGIADAHPHAVDARLVIRLAILEDVVQDRVELLFGRPWLLQVVVAASPLIASIAVSGSV